MGLDCSEKVYFFRAYQCPEVERYSVTAHHLVTCSILLQCLRVSRVWESVPLRIFYCLKWESLKLRLETVICRWGSYFPFAADGFLQYFSAYSSAFHFHAQYCNSVWFRPKDFSSLGFCYMEDHLRYSRTLTHFVCLICCIVSFVCLICRKVR